MYRSHARLLTVTIQAFHSESIFNKLLYSYASSLRWLTECLLNVARGVVDEVEKGIFHDLLSCFCKFLRCFLCMKTKCLLVNTLIFSSPRNVGGRKSAEGHESKKKLFVLPKLITV